MNIEISVETDDWAAHPDLAAAVERALRTAAEIADLPVSAGTEVSVLLTGDAAMRRLNRTWRGRDAATNVLSFPQQDSGALAGDIALGYETVAREARSAAIPFDHHVAHLVVHGLLHLFGFDHQDDRDAEAMEEMERAILHALGIADPYRDAAGAVRAPVA